MSSSHRFPSCVHSSSPSRSTRPAPWPPNRPGYPPSMCLQFIVIHRMSKAFEAGYDPALDLSNASRHRQRRPENPDEEEGHIVRDEQIIVDRIVRGEEVGSYYLVIGSKVSPIRAGRDTYGRAGPLSTRCSCANAAVELL